MSRRTKERLLDAAERQFGELGYAGMTLRGVSALAKCNVAAANYHFGSKEQLIIETLKRRIEPLNELRLSYLREARATAGDKPIPLSTIIEIVLRPLGEALMKGGKLDCSFLQMISRSLTEPSDFVQSLHDGFFREMKEEFGREVARHFPGVEPEEMGWKIMIAATTMIGAIIQAPFMPRAYPAQATNWNMNGMIDRLVPFIVAGLSADLKPKAER